MGSAVGCTLAFAFAFGAALTIAPSRERAPVTFADRGASARLRKFRDCGSQTTVSESPVLHNF
eukprot:8329536-Pyramimonas_sp.AAC.1